MLAAVFLAGFFVCGWYSLKLGLADSWDLRNYHYYTAYALLNGRFYLDYAAAQLQSFLNPLPFVPFYLLASHCSAKVTGFVLGGVHGLGFGLAFMIAMSLFSSMRWVVRLALALACAGLGVYAPAFLAELGSSGSDNLVSLFVLASVYALLSGIVVHGSPDERGARKAVLLGGVLMGVAAGLKLTCLVYLLGALAGLLLTVRQWRSARHAGGMFVAGSFAGFLLSRGFWMALLWQRFDSPLFPFFNKVFRSEYFYTMNWSDKRFLPTSFSEAIQMPFLFASDSRITTQWFDFRDSRFAVICVLVLLLAVGAMGRRLWVSIQRRPVRATPARRTERAAVFLVILFAVSFVLWEWRFSIYRYLVPLELLGITVIVALITLTVRTWYARVPMIVAAFVVIAIGVQPGRYPQRVTWPAKYIEVTVPELERPDETLVILASDQPWSYVIPFFPPGVRFIGLWSSYAKRRGAFGSIPHRGVDEMLAVVKAHQGPMYLLSRFVPGAGALNRVKEYGVREAARTKRDAPTKPRQRGVNSVHGGLPIQTFNETVFLWPVEVKQ